MPNNIQQAKEPYAPYRFNVGDYYRMVEADILDERARVELVGGQVLVKEPAGPQHAGHVDLLCNLFFRLLGERAIVRQQNPLRIDELNHPEPDIAVVKARDDWYRHEHPGPTDVLLLVETAWSSAHGDRRIKVPLYARAGIVEFWLIDIPNRWLEVYRSPAEDAYAHVLRLTRSDAISPEAFPDLTIAVGDIILPVTP